MAFDFGKYKTDKALETAGRWFEFDDGARFLIAATGNPRYQKLVRKHASDIRRAERGLLGDKASKELMAHIYARTILLGWEGVTDGGEPVPYSVSEAESRLQNRRFFADVQALADDYAHFRADEDEEDAKLLGEESGGRSDGGGLPRTPRAEAASESS